MDKDELWTMRDGTKIAVGDMDESHVRNALRLVLRNERKKRRARAALSQAYARALDESMTLGDDQDMLSNQAYDALSDPRAYFPLLEGGVHGSAGLAERHDPRRD